MNDATGNHRYFDLQNSEQHTMMQAFVSEKAPILNNIEILNINYNSYKFNPSAVFANENFYMLTRIDTNIVDFAKSTSSYELIQMDLNFSVIKSNKMTFNVKKRSYKYFYRRRQPKNLYLLNDIRLVDGSLTTNNNELIAYGTCAAIPEGRFDKQTTSNGVARQCLLEINITRLTINFLDFIDVPNASVLEKNFVIYKSNKNMILLYKVHPFISYKFNRLSNLLLFKNFCYNFEHQNSFFENYYPDLLLSISTPPIDFDHKNYLMIAHTKDKDRKYSQYAILIDKKNNIPIRISRHPIIEGGKNGLPNIIYVTSLCMVNGKLFVFMGYDDRKCAVSCIKPADLEDCLVPVSPVNS